MCGIIGIASSRFVSERGWLVAGRDAMQHRGPDGSGEWWSHDGRVGLAHRRLAVIDLSDAAMQPMTDSTGDYVIVFNGEIYNFKDLRAELAAEGRQFRSNSDTEVILAAYQRWGTDCLEKLNGMFAFALYDERARVVLLARDRAGEKPLFYSLGNGTLRFASELKGLMADPALPRRVDRESLDSYLARGFVPGDRSMLDEVRKLSPANALLFHLDSGQGDRWRYWQLPAGAAPALGRSDDDLLEELEPLLANAVRRQLVADVPLGILLSGGVDSSLVTALAARAARNVKTFTVRFPAHAEFDETSHARLIAAHFATDHVELDADEITPEILPVLARQFDEPLIDSSMIPTYLVSRLVRAHCTVALGGDGGDELFGGYKHYDRLLTLQRSLGWLPHGVRSPGANLAAALLPTGFKGRNWIKAAGADFERDVPLVANYFDPPARRRLMSDHGSWPIVDASLQPCVRMDGDLLERAARLDFATYLPEDILVKVDRASMLSSLEVRSPMLDRSVIEFAFREVPSRLKATPRRRKILLKKLTARLLPATFDRERKQGFSIPLDRWIRVGPWRDFFRDVLLDRSQTTFQRDYVSDLLAGVPRGRANGERLFGLVMFELWRREYRVAVA